MPFDRSSPALPDWDFPSPRCRFLANPHVKLSGALRDRAMVLQPPRQPLAVGKRKQAGGERLAPSAAARHSSAIMSKIEACEDFQSRTGFVICIAREPRSPVAQR